MSSPNPHRKRRILFVSEAVTLAQVVRLVRLGRALNPERYDVQFASASAYDVAFAGTAFQRHALFSLSPAQVERAVARGGRIYDKATLRKYVADDLRIIDETKPDLVVGDLRWSLLVSAPSRGVRLASLINAYWSPYRAQPDWPMPSHPIVKLLGVELASRYFPKGMPFALRHFAAPLNALRREAGLPEVGDLASMLVAGDVTLFPDVPELVPMNGMPATHHFLGPVLWSPEVALPAWWPSLDSRPLIYVTMGSSGDLRTLPRILEELAALPVQVAVATAGRARLGELPRNVFAADYLPGDTVAARAAVVVCNGGSSTGYQAIAAGAPVVGLPWNLDQYLAMTAMERAGCGVLLRSDALRPGQLGAAVKRALGGEFAQGVSRIGEAFKRADGPLRFAELVATLV